VFGVPGTQNVALFEGFRRHGLRTVLASHELAAAFMANGYFRASGRIAALATIPGPGFTYALTGLAEARHDSAGVLFLVGAPARGPGHAFRLQALDQRAIASPLVKACLTLTSSADVERVIGAAHAAASEGEPGPVMVELAMDALGVERARSPSSDRASSGPSAPAAAGGELARRFAQASRPLLLLGQGAFAAAEPLGALAEALTIPILTTPTARGIVPEDHELVLGFDPLRGHVATLNTFVDRADLVIALGCKLGHNGTAGFQLRLPVDRLIQVDADDAVLGATYPALLGITARVEDVVHELQTRRQPSQWSRAEIGAARRAVRAAAPEAVEPRIHGVGTPSDFVAWLRALLPRDAIVVTDSGLHQILVRRHLEVLSPRGLIVPTDFQSMGFGLPASIGARIAAPRRPVVAIVGDGGFLMSGLELLTMRRERLPIVTFVFNDGHLNQIRLQQLGSYGHAHAVDLVNPDFAQLAAALGVAYLRMGEATDDDVRRALRGGRPTLVEVVVGDSAPMHALPHVTRTKRLVRALLGSRGREWIKRRWRRPGA
jgi:acetolactate synthase-1/2/3 large subunit